MNKLASHNYNVNNHSKILIVDDDIENIELITQLLSKPEYNYQLQLQSR